MRIVAMASLCLLFGLLAHSKKEAKTAAAPGKKSEKMINQGYLKYCIERLKQGDSLKNARKICDCSLKKVSKKGLKTVEMLSKPSPKKLVEKTKEDRKRNEKLIDLSNLEVHSLEDCIYELKLKK